jgi:hypothetical protein
VQHNNVATCLEAVQGKQSNGCLKREDDNTEDGWLGRWDDGMEETMDETTTSSKTLLFLAIALPPHHTTIQPCINNNNNNTTHIGSLNIILVLCCVYLMVKWMIHDFISLLMRCWLAVHRLDLLLCCVSIARW